MKLNTAELTKSFQLNMTLHRVVIATFILAAIFCIAILTSDNQLINAGKTALTLFVVIGCYYGGLCAANSFSSEKGLKTWDNIRLSSMSAWDITVGKLFGSTLFAWYLGGLCLLMLVIALASVGSLTQSIVDILLLIITGLLIQTIALSIDIQSVESDQANSSSLIIKLGLLLAAFFAVPLVTLLIAGTDLVDMLGSSDSALKEAIKNPIMWYGRNFNSLYFALSSALIFWGWSLLSVYRQLNEILHCRSYVPWVWASFLLFLIGYVCGFTDEMKTLVETQSYTSVIGFVVSAISTYAVITYKPNSVIQYRLLWKSLRAGAWGEFAQNIPLWWVSFLFTIISMINIVITFPVLSGGENLKVFFTTTLFFMLRDIGIILYFGISNRTNKPRFMSFCYLFLLYLLLPILTSSAGFKSAEILFFPLMIYHNWSSIFPAMIQAAVMMFLLWRMNRKLRAQLD